MKRIHFIGVGGIGISALVRYFLSEGNRVSGSDLVISDLTEDLEREGLSFYKGHAASNVRPDVNLIIYSAAIAKNNPELEAGRGMRIKIQSYAQTLGALTKKYRTIAVSGSHGKSTTTALLALMMIEGGLDPTVIVGTKLREFSPPIGGSNFRKGASKYLVIEADEYNRSFHEYVPEMAIVTNIDAEHLDTYKNLKGVVAGFARYFKNIKKGGALVLNGNDKELRKLGERFSKGEKINVVFYNREKKKKFPLFIAGKHNQENADGAATAARLLGVGDEMIEKVCRGYQGAWRRLEQLTTYNLQLKTKAIIFSDYAHHPTEIKATLTALREKFPRKRIVCVFEPHQSDRLIRLFDKFKTAFSNADKAVFLPTFKVSGREDASSNKKKDSFALAQEVGRRKRQTFYAQTFEDAMKLVKLDLEAGAVFVFMGAGGIDARARQYFGI